MQPAIWQTSTALLAMNLDGISSKWGCKQYRIAREGSYRPGAAVHADAFDSIEIYELPP
jgi:hypothetical protein